MFFAGEIMKKIASLIIICVLFVLLCTVSVAAVMESSRASEMTLKLENSLKASFQESVSDMRAVESDLSKLMITTDNALITQTLSTLALKSAACGQELSKLPIVATGMQNTLKFVNQLSSYCVTVMRTEPKPENFEQQIREFFDTCREVNTQLADALNGVLSGEISLLNVGGGETETSGVFGSIAESMSEYPSVIFDGPFSDGQARTTPLREREAVSPEDAAEYVKNLGFNCKYSGEINGVIPAYTFSDDGIYLQVTKAGGLLLSAISSRDIGEASISEDEAGKRATAFAEKLGFRDSQIVWREFFGHYMIFNFAVVQDGIVVYPDIFKVQVALDNGEIVGFEGKSYIMSEHDRSLIQPEISEADAANKLKKGFNIESSRLCVISVNEREELCYEFFGNYDSLEYAVYISATDGCEKVSFRIISTDTGKMVI